MPSAMELLTASDERTPSYLSDKWNPMVGATAGFLMACFVNFMSRKPIISGVQQHALLTVAGGGLGYFVDQKRNAYFAEKDAVLRDYVRLHPDDFPTPERRKYSEIIETWVPIR